MKLFVKKKVKVQKNIFSMKDRHLNPQKAMKEAKRGSVKEIFYLNLSLNFKIKQKLAAESCGFQYNP